MFVVIRPLWIHIGDRWYQVAGFSVVAVLAVLVQFSWRPYRHYALLGAPFLAIAATLMAVALVQSIRWVVQRSIHTRLLILGVAAFPLVHAVNDPNLDLRYFWTTAVTGEPGVPRFWFQAPDVSADLEVVRAHVRESEELMVLPPRRNEVHFALGTRVRSLPWGYGWGEIPAEHIRSVLRWPHIRAVLVLHKLGSGDEVCWLQTGCADAVRELPALGFQLVTERPTMSLWRRPE
jgi:hypothetical protein